MSFARYHLGIETTLPGETETIDNIVASMQSETVKLAAGKTDRAVRAAHARTSGVLGATLAVHDELTPALRQGLFAQPGS